jgi:hypothetical protein
MESTVVISSPARVAMSLSSHIPCHAWTAECLHVPANPILDKVSSSPISPAAGVTSYQTIASILQSKTYLHFHSKIGLKCALHGHLQCTLQVKKMRCFYLSGIRNISPSYLKCNKFTYSKVIMIAFCNFSRSLAVAKSCEMNYM